MMGTSALIDRCTDQATNAPRRALRPSPTLHTARVHGCRLCRRPRWRMHKPPERRGAAAMSCPEHGTLRVGPMVAQAELLGVRVERSSKPVSAFADDSGLPIPEEGRAASGVAVRWHQYVDTLPDSTTLLIERGRRLDSALAAADDPRRARVRPSGCGWAKWLRPQRPGVAACEPLRVGRSRRPRALRRQADPPPPLAPWPRSGPVLCGAALGGTA